MFRQRFEYLFVGLLILCIIAACNRNTPAESDTPPGFRKIAIVDNDEDGAPDGWQTFGNAGDYQVSVDMSTGFEDDASILVQATGDNPSGFFAIGRELFLSEYRGQRVRLAGYVKSEDVSDFAALWFRVDGTGRGNTLAFDNMSSRPVVGTNEWRRYELVLDVPETGVEAIWYGFGLQGMGQAWVDEMQFDIVGEDVPVTDIRRYEPTLQNLDFEAGTADQPEGWQKGGSHQWEYTIGLDEATMDEGSHSGVIQSETAASYATGTIYQRITAEPYRGQRVRLSAYIKSENVGGQATMTMTMLGQRRTIEDDMSDRPITGTTEWQPYEIVLEVDEDTDGIAIAFTLQGQGTMWVDNVRLETAAEETTKAATGPSKQELFAQVVDLIEAQYVYEDFNGVDWETHKAEYRARIDEDLGNEQFWAAMKEMVAQLNDGHSAFKTPAEAQAADALFSGNPDYSGVGLFAAPLPQKRHGVVQLVFPDSPAANAGIQPHDRLLAANGEPLCCDENGRLRTNLVRGPAGTEVTLTVQTPGENPRDVMVARAEISGRVPVGARLVSENIGYISIPTLQDPEMGERVEAAWQTLNTDEQLAGLILDLRLNAGGNRSELQEILALFVDGEFGHFRRHDHTSPLRIEGHDVAGSQTIPLVVLVGEFTESNAEILAGVLQEAKRATIIGSATTGNVETVQSFDLPDGSRLLVAVETFVPPSGADWEQTGITPDIIAKQGWDEFANDENDQALQAGLEAINSVPSH